MLGSGSSEQEATSCRNGGRGGGGITNSGGGPGPPHSEPHSKSESNISHIKTQFNGGADKFGRHCHRWFIYRWAVDTRVKKEISG